MIVFELLIGLATSFWILFLWRRRRFYKLMLEVNGPKGLPLVGIAYKFRSLEDVYYQRNEIIANYKFPILTWLGPIPVLVVADPVTTQDILTSPNCVNKALFYTFISEVIGDGLITQNNPNWVLHRKWLNIAFSPSNIRKFVPIFNEKSKGFLDKFEASYNGDPIETLPLLLQLTMNTSLETTMGMKQDPKREESEEKLFHFYHRLEKLVMKMIFMPWLRIGIVQRILPSMREYLSDKKDLQTYIKNLIGKKIQSAETSNKTPGYLISKQNDNDSERRNFTFMDLSIDLLRIGRFTTQDVEDHCNHIIAGSFETSAVTISNTLLMFAMHPQYQKIAFEELASVFPDRDNIFVTEEDLKRLVYLEMAINETMRLLPTVPIIARKVSADTMLSSGVLLPKGVQILINMYDLHRNEETWGPNATAFNPDNFLPENVGNRHPYSFIPFTKGLRSCIGIRYGMMLVKTIVASIMRKYRLSTDGELDKLIIEPTISIRIVNNPLVQFHLREE